MESSSPKTSTKLARSLSGGLGKALSALDLSENRNHAEVELLKKRRRDSKVSDRSVHDRQVSLGTPDSSFGGNEMKPSGGAPLLKAMDGKLDWLIAHLQIDMQGINDRFDMLNADLPVGFGPSAVATTLKYRSVKTERLPTPIPESFDPPHWTDAVEYRNGHLETEKPIIKQSNTISSMSSKQSSPYPTIQQVSELPSFRKMSNATSWSVPSDILGNLMNLMGRVRHRSSCSKQLWIFLDEPELVQGGTVFKWLMSILTVMSAIIPMFQSVPNPPLDPFHVALTEIVLDATCTVETSIRFTVCPNFLAFFFNSYNIIDFMAGPAPLLLRAWTVGMGPTRIEIITGVSFFLVCVLPILRLTRLLRRFETFHLLYKAFTLSLEALPVLLFTLVIIVLSFSALIYAVEPRDNISSLPQSIWFTIVTVGTIGYGDITPVSPSGTVIVSVLIVVSALYMAIPIGVVGNIFSFVWEKRDQLLLAHTMRRRFFSVGYKAKDIPAMFVYFDLDGDGELSLGEFASMMTKLQIDLSGARIIKLFSTFDGDGNGTIDDREFMKTLFPNEYSTIYGQASDDSEESEETEAVGVVG